MKNGGVSTKPEDVGHAATCAWGLEHKSSPSPAVKNTRTLAGATCDSFKLMRGCKPTSDDTWKILLKPSRNVTAHTCMQSCQRLEKSVAVNNSFCCFYDPKLGCFVMNHGIVSQDPGDTGQAAMCNYDTASSAEAQHTSFLSDAVPQNCSEHAEEIESANRLPLEEAVSYIRSAHHDSAVEALTARRFAAARLILDRAICRGLQVGLLESSMREENFSDGESDGSTALDGFVHDLWNVEKCALIRDRQTSGAELSRCADEVLWKRAVNGSPRTRTQSLRVFRQVLGLRAKLKAILGM